MFMGPQLRHQQCQFFVMVLLLMMMMLMLKGRKLLRLVDYPNV